MCNDRQFSAGCFSAVFLCLLVQSAVADPSAENKDRTSVSLAVNDERLTVRFIRDDRDPNLFYYHPQSAWVASRETSNADPDLHRLIFQYHNSKAVDQFKEGAILQLGITWEMASEIRREAVSALAGQTGIPDEAIELRCMPVAGARAEFMLPKDDDSSDAAESVVIESSGVAVDKNSAGAGFRFSVSRDDDMQVLEQLGSANGLSCTVRVKYHMDDHLPPEDLTGTLKIKVKDKNRIMSVLDFKEIASVQEGKRETMILMPESYGVRRFSVRDIGVTSREQLEDLRYGTATLVLPPIGGRLFSKVSCQARLRHGNKVLKIHRANWQETAEWANESGQAFPFIQFRYVHYQNIPSDELVIDTELRAVGPATGFLVDESRNITKEKAEIILTREQQAFVGDLPIRSPYDDVETVVIDRVRVKNDVRQVNVMVRTDKRGIASVLTDRREKCRFLVERHKDGIRPYDLQVEFVGSDGTTTQWSGNGRHTERYIRLRQK